MIASPSSPQAPPTLSLRSVGRCEIAVLAVIVACATALLTFRLGEGCLCEEEALLATLARNALKYGVPCSWDGRNLTTRAAGFETNTDGVWTGSEWLPIYLTGASFALFGTGVFTARWPSTVCGLASLLILYAMVRRYSQDGRMALLSAAFLGLNVHFVLLVRQCQWYALAIVGTLAVVWYYLSLIHPLPPARASVGLALGLAALFHTDRRAYWLVLAGLACHLIWSGGLRERRSVLLLVAGWGGSVALALPWWGYLRWADGAMFSPEVLPPWHGPSSPFVTIWEQEQAILSPLVLFAAAWWCPSPAGPRCVRGSLNCLPTCAILGSAVVLPLLFASPSAAADGRACFAPALPALAVLAAILVGRWWRTRPAVALAAGVLLLSTNVADRWLVWLLDLEPSEHRLTGMLWRNSLGDVGARLARRDRGPMVRLVAYLDQRGRPGDVIFASDDANSLAFHTRLRVIRDVPFPSPPRFVVLREDGDARDIARRSLATFLREQHYRLVRLSSHVASRENGSASQPAEQAGVVRADQETRGIVVWERPDGSCSSDPSW